MSLLTADLFNETYSIGTRVKAWPGVKNDKPLLTKTRSIAWNLCGTPVVSVEGKSGGIALSHIEVIYDGDEAEK